LERFKGYAYGNFIVKVVEGCFEVRNMPVALLPAWVSTMAAFWIYSRTSRIVAVRMIGKGGEE